MILKELAPKTFFAPPEDSASLYSSEASSPLENLLEIGREQGFVLQQDVLFELLDSRTSLDEIDPIIDKLAAQNIEIRPESPESQVRKDAKLKAAAMAELKQTGVDDLVALYLTEQSQTPLLSQMQEVDLAKKIEAGRSAKQELENIPNNPNPLMASKRRKLEQEVEEGEIARKKLIESNTRLVVSIARKYYGGNLSLLDLIQEGNLGLIRAIEKFDYSKGYRLSTYATWWIRQNITRALADKGRTIRVPFPTSGQIQRLYRISEQLEQNLGRAPNPEEIAAAMGIEPKMADFLLQKSLPPLSLNTPVGEKGNTELEEVIELESDSIQDPNESLHQNLRRQAIEEALSSINPREALIIRLRFGFQDGKPHTLAEIARKFGVTRERIRQIEARALHRLRHPRLRRQLRDYL